MKQAMEEIRSVLAQFFLSSEHAFTENLAAIVADRGLLIMTKLSTRSLVVGSLLTVLFFDGFTVSHSSALCDLN